MLTLLANLPMPVLLAGPDDEAIKLIVGLVVFGFLISLGLIFGRATEKRHLASIAARQTAIADMLVTDLRSLPMADPAKPGAELVVGEVVIGSDYLKTWLAGLRNIFGGEVKSFETLLRRARLEAQLRVIEQAKSMGYNAVCNVRLEFCGLGGSAASNKAAAPMASVIASATAYHAATT